MGQEVRSSIVYYLVRRKSSVVYAYGRLPGASSYLPASLNVNELLLEGKSAHGCLEEFRYYLSDRCSDEQLMNVRVTET